uniref:Uncharacterized protein n=1 Tax=Rhizophora mucronata TaxID=61149 RepID=A0A2P2NWC8_RHIMU
MCYLLQNVHVNYAFHPVFDD